MMASTQQSGLSIATADARVMLRAALRVPLRPKGVVLLAHGSGASHESPQELRTAEILNRARFATLRLDLLDRHEARDHHNVFDAELLATRLVTAARWVRGRSAIAALPLGYLGAGTGAAAAVIAAVREPALVSAIVLRGCHPDQVTSWLHRVHVPTLLIAGALDEADANRRAYQEIAVEKECVLVPGAGHLFEQPGTLEQAAAHASRWFERHLVKSARRSRHAAARTDDD